MNFQTVKTVRKASLYKTETTKRDDKRTRDKIKVRLKIIKRYKTYNTQTPDYEKGHKIPPSNPTTKL